MAWSYKKRIKVIPGVHLNFSKKGISTSIGIKGASINFSNSGTTVNTIYLGFQTVINFGIQNPTPLLYLIILYLPIYLRISSVLISKRLQVKICRELRKQFY